MCLSESWRGRSAYVPFAGKSRSLFSSSGFIAAATQPTGSKANSQKDQSTQAEGGSMTNGQIHGAKYRKYGQHFKITPHNKVFAAHSQSIGKYFKIQHIFRR